MENDERFPRLPSTLERELLLWLLPEDRPGYRPYRAFVERWKIAGRGRRGEGNYILTSSGANIDTTSPLPRVLAHGVVETTEGGISVTLRELLDDQLEFELTGLERVRDLRNEIRRWSFSSWLPKMPCPVCGSPVRTVEMQTEQDAPAVLAICSNDRRIWVHDSLSQVNHLIPITNFYNELMITLRIRDANVALNPARLFSDLPGFSDADLSRAFAKYNAAWTRIGSRIIVEEPQKKSFLKRILSLVSGEKNV